MRHLDAAQGLTDSAGMGSSAAKLQASCHILPATYPHTHAPGVLHSEPVGFCLSPISLGPQGCCKGCPHVREVWVLPQQVPAAA